MNNLKYTQEELQRLATQLGCPSGSVGVDVGLNMEVSNMSMIKNTIQELHPQHLDHILELGFGNGAHIPSLLKQQKSITYKGLEISETMRTEAQKINKSWIQNQRASLHAYDGIHIPFQDNSFNKIFTVNTIYFWKNPAALIAELYRVLKKGGVLAITYAHKEFMLQLPFTKYGFTLYDTPKILRLIKNIPFKNIDICCYTEQVKSKIGTMVNRDYSLVLLQK